MNVKSVMRDVIVINAKGLHARPASLIAKAAALHTSEIKVIKGEEEADAKSVLSLLILAASEGTPLTLWAKGEDGMRALDALEELFLNRFGEE